MRRRLPFFTPASIAFAVLLSLGFGYTVWKSGGLGINPGPLTAKSRPGSTAQGFASHADFEQDCNRCHPSLTEVLAKDRYIRSNCLECHSSVQQQAKMGTGVHARLDQDQRCDACHPDHRGRDFDPTEFAVAGLNHDRTRYPLTGKHIQVACSGCHTGQQYQVKSLDCAACHAAPAVHEGVFDINCAACHTTGGWKPATVGGAPYDHASTAFQITRHAVDYEQQPITCVVCHRGGAFLKAGASEAAAEAAACAECHSRHDAAFMQKHQDWYGADCLACHDGADRMVPFDHAKFFPLDGKHAAPPEGAASCSDCHAGKKFKGVSTECAACHSEPKIHAGAFGQRCEDCHTSAAWTPALLKNHAFPIDHGGQGEQTCQTCHQNTYAEYTCYACHKHQPDEIAASHSQKQITPADLPNCARCHPAGK